MTSTGNLAVQASGSRQSPSPGRSRINSVDALRGAVMIIMTIDHTRDFIHSAAMSFFPTDLAQTTPSIFFTRWITHFCAPVFAFTAGIGIFLWAGEKKRRHNYRDFS
jgi:uncharacterized membrane protein